MPNLKTVILTFFVAISLIGCAHKATEANYGQFGAIKPDVSSLGINNIRLAALKEAANTLAAQTGLAWRSRQINAILNSQQRHLDRVFNFNAMLLDHNILPPVLVEARYTLNLADNETIRLSDRDYKIVNPARFVTATPSWRDYLWMSYSKPESPNATLLPKNEKERIVWNRNVRIGWNEGVTQANEIFSANLSRLHRDFDGMVLYRKLYAQNMVSAPFVSQADLGITGDGNALRINDRVLRITAISQLNTNSKKWKPVLTTKKGAHKPRVSSSCRSKVSRGRCDRSLKSLLEKLP